MCERCSVLARCIEKNVPERFRRNGEWEDARGA